MTTARERPAPDRGPAPAARSVLTRVRGIPWWACLLLGLLPTIGCVVADVVRTGTVGLAFFVGYPLGCVLAVLAARRDGLFVPMVQPPLALAVAVPVAVAAAGSLPTSGGLATVLALAGPLIAGFPAMAITTTLCLALGGARLVLQPAADTAGPPSGRRSGSASPARDGADRRRDRDRPERDRPERDRPERSGSRSGSATGTGSGSARTPLRVTSRQGRPTDGEPGPARATDRLSRATAPPAPPSSPSSPPPPAPQGQPAPPPPHAPAPTPSAGDDIGLPTQPAPRAPAGPTAPVVGTDDEPARRSPLVLPPDDGREPDRSGSGRPVPSRDAERRRRIREERMRADRMREERRREGQREAAQAEQRRETDRRADSEQWGPRRRPEG